MTSFDRRSINSSGILSLVLIAWMGSRFFHGWAAIGALMFAIASPMELAVARRGWQEAMVGFLSLLLVHFCCEITRQPRQKRWYVLFLAVGAYGLLIKEGTTWVLYAALVLWILTVIWFERRSLKSVAFFAGLSLLGAVVGLGLLALAAGGVTDVVKVIQHNTGSIASNEYAVRYQDGPWYSLPWGLWLLSPSTLILFLVAVIGILAQGLLHQERRWIPSKSLLMSYAMIALVFAFVIVVSAPDYYKNLRYVSVIYGPMFLLNGVAVRMIVSILGRRFQSTPRWVAISLVVLLLLASASVDYRTFDRVFIDRNVPDLVNDLISRAK